jgi:hypothetical protein
LRDCAAKGIDAPWDLGVGHESGGACVDVGGEGGREFALIEE